MYYIGEDLVSGKILSESSSLSVLAIGGESCPSVSTLRKWKHPKCKTRLYNIYGITEVSSWATCYHITDDELNVTVDDHAIETFTACELGAPLSQTELIVYDDNGELVSENGIGHLQIGLFCLNIHVLIYVSIILAIMLSILKGAADKWIIIK